MSMKHKVKLQKSILHTVKQTFQKINCSTQIELRKKNSGIQETENGKVGVCG